jgi:hypothetical protein
MNGDEASRTDLFKESIDWNFGLGIRIGFLLAYIPLRPVAIAAPASPALSNVLCFDLQVRLNGICQSCGVNYTRYADELFFFGE